MRIFILFTVIIFIGCTKLDPHPELRDPIFKDLEGQLAEAKKAKEELEKELEEARVEYEKVIPQSGQYKIKRSAVFELENKVQFMDQQIHYLLVRVDSRKYEANVAYRKAFSQSKEWPDPSEYEKYKMEKGLSLRSNNFYQNRMAASQGSAKKKPKKEEGEGGGGGH